MQGRELTCPAYVFWKNDLTFVQVGELSSLLTLFEINDVLQDDLFGWDSVGRHFTLEWDKESSSPAPVLWDIDPEGFRSAVQAYKEGREGVAYESDLFGHCGAEVSPRLMQAVLEKILDEERNDMITIYYWEDDPEAEDLIDELKKRGLEYQAELLDAENPNASQSVEYQEKLYSDFREFLRSLD